MYEENVVILIDFLTIARFLDPLFHAIQPPGS